jgi:fimbrial chaperone protein
MRSGVLGRIFAAAFMLGAACATASSFSVMPVRATLTEGKPSVALTVRNTGAEPAVVQLEVQSWSQVDSRDVLAPTRELLASPPIFTIAPGAAQVVRVGARRAPDPGKELAYRLFLQEVPPPPQPGFRGLRMALRLSIPVFLGTPSSQAARLVWSAASAANGELRLSLSNQGSAHVQVASVAAEDADGALIERRQVAAYVLPGQSRDWLLKPLHPARVGAQLRIAAETDGGPLASEAHIEER